MQQSSAVTHQSEKYEGQVVFLCKSVDGNIYQTPCATFVLHWSQNSKTTSQPMLALLRALNGSLYVNSGENMFCCAILTERCPDVRAQMHWHTPFKALPICANVHVSLFASHNSYCGGNAVQYCQSVCVLSQIWYHHQIFIQISAEKASCCVVLFYCTFESLKPELFCPRGLGNVPCWLAWDITE